MSRARHRWRSNRSSRSQLDQIARDEGYPAARQPGSGCLDRHCLSGVSIQMRRCQIVRNGARGRPQLGALACACACFARNPAPSSPFSDGECAFSRLGKRPRGFAMRNPSHVGARAEQPHLYGYPTCLIPFQNQILTVSPFSLTPH